MRNTEDTEKLRFSRHKKTQKAQKYFATNERELTRINRTKDSEGNAAGARPVKCDFGCHLSAEGGEVLLL